MSDEFDNDLARALRQPVPPLGRDASDRIWDYVESALTSPGVDMSSAVELPASRSDVAAAWRGRRWAVVASAAAVAILGVVGVIVVRDG